MTVKELKLILQKLPDEAQNKEIYYDVYLIDIVSMDYNSIGDITSVTLYHEKR